jgi:hypothetical protein
METTNIYILIDPRDNKVRYVGKANNVSQRYKAHLNRARKHQIHKASWIKQLKDLGLKPIIEVIDVVPINEWIFWETYWIAQFKAWGFDLINYTSGGDGCTFANQTSFKKGQGGKKVVGYNSNYEKLYEFETAEDATKFFKTHRSSIPRCASGKSKTIKNIAWFYYDNIINLANQKLKELINKRFINESKPNSGSFKLGQKSLKSKSVLMFNLNNQLIKKFDSAKEAADYIGVTGGAIQFACLKSKKNKCKNYIFKYGTK